MYSLILILPFLSAIVSGFFGRKIGVKGSHILGSTTLIITAIIGIILFIDQIKQEKIIEIKLIKWIDCETININWNFTLDSLTISMFLPILIVSSLVHVYSIGYMNEDNHNQRFFAYLSMFTFAMLILVTAENLIVMFLGWEGVGVASYLLINFWFTRIQANKSAISALLTNRVGDMFLTIGFFVIILFIGNLDYSTIFSISGYLSNQNISIIGIFILIGAMAKSAQFGLHSWLPMAMEGPSNVSSLIHAATMVTAGVFLLIRTSPLIEYSNTVLLLALWIGAITAIFAALIGLFQNDMKKIIAYSTCSQLGMLFIAIGLSQYNIALFHLSNHAFFKALLFLSAGSVIHSINDEQSLRKMGGFIKFLPFSYLMILIGSLSLMALPFLSGFYSKELIIESAFGGYSLSSNSVYVITIISATLTSLYSMKLIYLTFLSKPNISYQKLINIHEPSLSMGIPLIVLAILSIFFGYFSKDIFVGLGSPFFGNSIYILPSHSIILQTEFAPSFYKIISGNLAPSNIPLFITIAVIIFSILIYEIYPYTNTPIRLKLGTKLGQTMYYHIYTFFNQRFYFEYLLERYILNKALNLGYIYNKDLDRGILEIVGPYGYTKLSFWISNMLKKLDTGLVTNYALYIFLALVVFLTLFSIPSLEISLFSLSNSLFLSDYLAKAYPLGFIFIIACFINIPKTTPLVPVRRVGQGGHNIDKKIVKSESKE